MAITGLLQFTPQLGICRNQKSSLQLKYSFRREILHLPSTNLSSLSLGQDLLTQHLSKSIKRPICAIPFRYNSLNCRSSLSSDSDITNSCLKAVATALARSYNSLQGSPSVIKLITAVGVVAFTLWGLGPLVRTCRNLFLHKNDNSWRKSTTYSILNSYLQPALLWTGAMLVCSSLDPVVMPTEASRLVKQRVLSFLRSLTTVVSFAYCLSCAIQQAQKIFMQTSNPSDTRNMGFQFAAKAVYSAVWVAAVSLFMELLGFSTQKWLTAGGLGTVLLTLAGREIFTNFLSSAMIHATRPFVLNEWIQTKIEGYEVSGTVEHVGWWSPTIIRGEDREAVHIPNHKFTMNVVRNLSQKTHWRIKTHLAISHLDVNKINTIVADMRKVLAKNPQVEQQKLHRRVFLDYINPENQALTILISCFVKTSHHEEYLCVKDAILLDLLRVISHHRARLATPIRTIQKVYSEADVESAPFSESAFSRSRAASNRPFLLIEPSYKINGEERAKPARSTRSGGDQDSRSTGQSASDSKMDAKTKGNPASESKSVETTKSSTKIETSDGDAQGEYKGSPTSASAASALKMDDKRSVKSSTSTSTSTSFADKESKVDDSVVSTSTSTNLDKKPDPEESQQSDKSDSPLSSESSDKRPIGPSSVSPQSKQGEKASPAQPAKPGPAVEENIVLGVALEGSKRTLPIDADHPGSPPPVEAKEAAATQNSIGNGKETPTSDKDENDKY